MSLLWWAVLALLLVLGAWVQFRANRLDRLHIRTDAAAAGLRAALERRAVVARAIAAVLPDGLGRELRAAADAAESAPPAEREAAENELTRLLAALDEVPADLRAELVEAEQRVLLSRRVHNDAVRDTLALRATRLVRWFRLAGTARAPQYFEIAEDPLTARPPAAGPVPTPRTSARVLLLDPDGRVLLFEGTDPAHPDRPYWFTVGGEVNDGEDLRAAAVREVREETGLVLPEGALVGPVDHREHVFGFDGAVFAASEWFFVARCAEPVEVLADGREEIEHAMIRRHRWWSESELRSTTETVYPAGLVDLITDRPGSA